VEAQNGKEAAKLAENAEIDLVIMDLAMPVQEGIKTIRALHQVRPRLKIISISG
jgi:YesN/AraC family two-component response regulator